MAESIDLGDDDGIIEVTMSGVTVDVDLWEVNDRLADLTKEKKTNAEYSAAVQAILTSLGLPEGSHRMAYRFTVMVMQQCEILKKKDSTTAASGKRTPASTPAA